MAFIKVENIVINTNYIAAVQLQCDTCPGETSDTCPGETSISILMAIPKFPLLELESVFPNPYSYEWLEFTGREARVLRDYFSSFNNVIDLLP